MASKYNAASKIQHPTRLFIVGSAQTGKTTFMVDLIKNYFASQVNRIIACGPTFNSQKTYDPIRQVVKKEDIYSKLNNKSLQMLIDRLEASYLKARTLGTEPEKVLVFIDDLAGNSVIHGKRQGPFAQLATQVTHWNFSLFVISQQPTCTDPNFRDNAENIVVFRDKGEGTYKWLKCAYTALDQDKELVKRVILTAWQGGLGSNKELGKHFLFIHAEPRGGTRFFIDFDQEINVT